MYHGEEGSVRNGWGQGKREGMGGKQGSQGNGGDGTGEHKAQPRHSPPHHLPPFPLLHNQSMSQTISKAGSSLCYHLDATFKNIAFPTTKRIRVDSSPVKTSDF